MSANGATYKSRTINFLGVGGHACGSTKLYHLMKAHPEIGFVHRSREPGIDIRGKECHYWDRYSARPMEWYLSYFKWEYPCVGEITPAYARLNAQTVELVRTAFPRIHVFFIIRDTLERTWSNIRKNVVKQGIRSPTVAWMISQAEEEKTISRNDYVRTVEVWHNAYKENFHVILFDDFVADPRRIMVRIARLLKVDSLFYERLDNEVLGMQINPTRKMEMPDEFKRWYWANSRFGWEAQIKQITAITALL